MTQPAPMPPRPPRLRPGGFTLIELGIVIGVTAILAAAIVPDVIETMRNRMAEKAAADVTAIHDSARLFFAQNTVRPRRWPGEVSAGQCNTGWTFDAFKNDMIGGGYLATGGGPTNPFASISPNFMMNPWSQVYEVSLYAPVASPTTPSCLFGVSTVLPAAVADAFIANLPQATCGAGCPGDPPPAGMSRCCSFVPKPGVSVFAACGTRAVVRNASGVLSCP
jgi:type II secretory pathway pseudopilin PulG